MQPTRRAFLMVMVLLACAGAWAQTTWFPTGLYTGSFHAVKQCQGSPTYYMAASASGVYRTTDFINWTDVTAQFGGNTVNCFVSWTEGFTSYTAAGTSAGVYRTNDSGLTWTQASGTGRIPTTVNVYALFSPGGGRMLAGTNDGIYFSLTYDQSFGKLASPAVAEAYCFTTYMMSGQTTVYCGTSNGVYSSAYPSYGASWGAMNNASTTGKAVRSLIAGGSGLLAAVWDGATGLGLYTSPRSTAWVASNSGLGNLNVNALAAATNLYAATDDGLYESTNSGSTWTDNSSTLPSRVVKVVTPAVSSGLVTPQGGGVYRKGTPVLPPTPVSPANNATDVAVPTTLTWSYPVGTPTSYDVQYSTSATFASGNVLVSSIPGTATQLTGLPPSVNYYWRVRAAFGAALTGYSSTFKFTTAETAVAPTTPTTLTFSTTTPITTDDITATGGGSTDANAADTVSYLYEWAVSLNDGLTYSPWGFAGATLDAADTGRGERWKCRTRATDGVLESDWFESPTVLTIANSAPTAPTDVTFNPVAPTPLEDVTATAVGATDIDADPLLYVVEWAVSKDDGATFSDWIYNGPTLSAAATDNLDQWKVRARATDGVLFSPWYESATVLIIGGRPPSAPTDVTFNPLTPLTADDITATATGAVDPVGNPMTLIYEWSVSTDNGGTWSAYGNVGATLSASATSRGEQWKARARAESIEGSSPWFYPLDILTIGNTVPTAPTSTGITPVAPFSTDDLAVASSGATDADAGPLTYDYEWAKSTDSGATWGAWGNAGAVLASALTARGEQWKARGRATDGLDSSAWLESTPVTIGNSAFPAVILNLPQGSNVGAQWPLIRVGFEQAMDKALTQTAFSLTQEGTGTVVPGNFSWVGNELRYAVQGALLPATIYRATVDTTAALATGATMGTPFTWTFTTNNVPTIDSWAPKGTVARGVVVRVSFNQTMDTAATEAAFALNVAGTMTPVAGTFNWSGNELQFAPSVPLAAGTGYQASVTTGAQSSGGVALGAGFNWAFTTGGGPAVASWLPQGTVSRDTVVSVVFDQAMNPTATQAAFSLKAAGSTTPVAGSFSWTGNEMTFTPSLPLAVNTSYHAALNATATSSAGLATGALIGWDFMTSTEPAVTLHEPQGTNAGAQWPLIRVGFERAMDQALTQAAFSLTQEDTGANVPGYFSWSGNQLRYSVPGALAPSTTYRVTVAATAALATGEVMSAPFTWTFTTNNLPTVDQWQPKAVVARNTVVRVSFNQAMDTAATQGAFSLRAVGTMTPVPGAFSWSGNEMWFTPSASLAASTVYRAAFITAAKSAANVPLGASFAWNFTTGGGPAVVSWQPQGPASPNAAVSVGFDQAMDPVATQAAFSLKAAGTPTAVPGSFSWSGNVMSFAPSAPLSASTSYQAAVTAFAQSAGGVGLGSLATHDFTTIDASGVALYLPQGSAVGAQWPIIRVGFDQAMNQPVTQAAFSLTQDGTTTPVSGTFAWVGNELRYSVPGALAPATTYRVTVDATAQLATGAPIAAPFTWTFTTNDVPAVDHWLPRGTVAVNAVLRVGFNRPMDTTATEGAFSLTAAGSPTPVAGAFSWSGNELQFTPAAPLAAGTSYRAALTVAAQSSGGVALGAPFGWNLNTAAAPVGALSVASVPTASGAQIVVSLGSAAEVIVSIRNLAGREVAILTPGKLAAGMQSLLWNGKSKTGTQVPRGMYLLEVKAQSADGSSRCALTSLRR